MGMRDDLNDATEKIMYGMRRSICQQWLKTESCKLPCINHILTPF
jgi:hypothetical protein